MASVGLIACDSPEERRPAFVPQGSLTADGGGDDGDDNGGDEEEGDDGGDEGLGDCAEVQVKTETVSPTIVVLVDRSWSMTKDFAGAERWGAIYRTLMHPDTGVITRLQSQVRFGLTLYTSKNGAENDECPILTDVDPLLDNAAAIDAILSSKNPLDEGPTGESLELTAVRLSQLEADGPKVIVLATDGEPDTCAQPNPDEGRPQALAAAGKAFELGIATYIVSVGEDVTEDHLQQMANVGVGQAPDSATPAPYYKALNPDQLVAAFDEIVTELVQCDATIEGIVDIDKACTGKVVLDGKTLECGVDFELSDASTLVLLGSACNSLKSGGDHMLDASWPCDAINIP